MRRYTHTTLQQVSPKIKRVCYNLPAVRAFILHFFIRLFVVLFAVGKVAMATKTVYCFRHYSSFFCEKRPIQLFFIMIVDVGAILFQLKITVIAFIEYIY